MVPQAAIDLIKSFESCKLTAYPDPKQGWALPTIGYGMTIYPSGEPVQRGDSISAAFAISCLSMELNNSYEPELAKIPTWQQMNSNQRAALISFAYNLGAHFYNRPHFESITRVCDSPDRWSDTDWIAAQFDKYDDPGTSLQAGLLRRRQAEAQLFCTPEDAA